MRLLNSRCGKKMIGYGSRPEGPSVDLSFEVDEKGENKSITFMYYIPGDGEGEKETVDISWDRHGRSPALSLWRRVQEGYRFYATEPDLKRLKDLWDYHHTWLHEVMVGGSTSAGLLVQLYNEKGV